MVEFKLLDELERLVSELADQAAHKHLSLQSFVDPQIPAYFCAESGDVIAAVKSLMKSAIDKVFDGDIYIAAEYAQVADQAGAQAPILFQLSTTDFQPPPPHMYKLIEELGSKLEYSTSPGVGALWRFIVSLTTSNKRIEKPVFSQIGSEVRIFVVSNQPPPNRVIQNYLRYAGIRCDGAPTARESLTELSRVASFESPYQLIMIAPPILDMDPFALSRALRQSALENTSKLIYVDRYFDPITRAKALSAGFDSYLAKPLEQQEIFDSTTKVLGGTVSFRKILPKSAPIILVAEDNPVNQRLVLFQLRRLGYDADAVDNGLDAVRALAKKPDYSLVLMDLAMPVLNGWDAAAKIRTERGGRNEIPIIALTTDDSPQAQERCRQAGINEIAYKPISIDKLKAVLTKYAPIGEQRYKAS